MLEELEARAARGIAVGDRLRISDRAHLVIPYHKKQDLLSEAALGDGKIGTTARGIGPCYADKMLRASAVRVADLFNTDALSEKITRVVRQKNTVFQALYGDAQPLDAGAIIANTGAYADASGGTSRTRPRICTTPLQAGRRLLFEGANGTLLDIEPRHVPLRHEHPRDRPGGDTEAAPVRACRRGNSRLLGVSKGYTTRVGPGPSRANSRRRRAVHPPSAADEYGRRRGVAALRVVRRGWPGGTAATGRHQPDCGDAPRYAHGAGARWAYL
jgi:adenylosuccinate synthase